MHRLQWHSSSSIHQAHMKLVWWVAAECLSKQLDACLSLELWNMFAIASIHQAGSTSYTLCLKKVHPSISLSDLVRFCKIFGKNIPEKICNTHIWTAHHILFRMSVLYLVTTMLHHQLQYMQYSTYIQNKMWTGGVHVFVPSFLGYVFAKN